jgi:hypothetical protein
MREGPKYDSFESYVCFDSTSVASPFSSLLAPDPALTIAGTRSRSNQWYGIIGGPASR